MILDATPGGIERISYRDGQIIGRLVVDGYFRAGHTEIEPNVEGASFAMVMNRSFDHDVASGKPRK